jgi:hypothetical protein
VVHKRQDARILTFSLSKASPSASHQLFLDFVLNQYLCYSLIALKFIGIVWRVAALRFSFSIIHVYPYYNSYRSLEMARCRHRCR